MATVAVDAARELRPPRFWDSTNGKKAVMAVTGCILFLFVIGHLIGNLQVFEGPDKINAYGRLLRVEPLLLWVVRLVLLGCVVMHIWASVSLGLRKMAARPVGYAGRKNVNSDYASRTMYWSGPIVLAFIIYHLLDLTGGVARPGSTFVEGNVYHNMIADFQVWYVSAWYIFAMILLGMHLRHGLWSMFQSLGFNHPRHTGILKKTALAIAVIITAGYISIPVSILAGALR